MATIYPPTGSILAWGGAVAPTCYLLCDGTSYLRTAWPELFAVIGTAFGYADSTHFNVPDLRGRSPLGVSPGLAAPRPTARVMGAVGGEEGHLLDVAEMPSHDHGGLTGNAYLWFEAGAAPGGGVEYKYVGTGAHAHSIAAQGGGGAHNTMHPFQVTQWIIKT